MSGLTIGKGAVWALSSFLIWQSAWLSDDSLITLRSALNWSRGYGPQFNIDEAVQSFTHPLWFLLVTVVGTVTDSWVYAPLYLNVVCASLAVLLLVGKARNAWQVTTIGTVLVLGNTALDWSTSGLEGGLSAMLLAVLSITAVQKKPALAGMVAGLLLLCRLDFAVLLGPWAVVYSMKELRDFRQRLGFCAAAVAPVALWAVWAKFTYGFVLPATFSAKTNSEIPATDLASRGIEYLARSLAYDPILVLLALAFLPLLWAVGDRLTRAWVLGILAYAAYVGVIGGDYMLGRFLYAPLFVCLLELTRTHLPSPNKGTASLPRSVLWAVSVGLLVVGLANTRAFDWKVTEDQGNPEYPYYADERIGWTHWGRSLNPFGLVERRPPYYPTDLTFLEAQASAWPRNAATTEEPIVICHGLGGMGFLVGPRVHIIDPCGLTDRFLASLPYTPTGTWKAGHFERPLPSGYLRAVKYDDPSQVTEPHLSAQLEDLWRRIRRDW